MDKKFGIAKIISGRLYNTKTNETLIEIESFKLSKKDWFKKEEKNEVSNED